MAKAAQKRVVLLFSGGLDSTTLAFKLINEGHQVFPLYGSKAGAHGQYDNDVMWNAWRWLNANVLDHNVGLLHPPIVFNYNSHVKSTGEEIGRHLQFISPAINYAIQEKATHIAIATYLTGRSAFRDASAKFMYALEDLLKASDLQHLKLLTMGTWWKADSLACLAESGMLQCYLNCGRWCYKRSDKAIALDRWIIHGCGNCLSCKLMIKHMKIFIKESNVKQ